ncbi:MAG TPA: GNAT family N-acetyltransferase [Pyrinomonadaceae bacterium]|nr:GNAT family N-acetyltransferase [Pyrinomonadaceae bacterium]
MPDEPRIEQFRLADLDALLDFLRLGYPDEPRKYDPEYWKWHYLEHPLIDSNDLPIWVLRDGKRIVGQAAALPADLKVGDTRLRAAWVLDFVILEELRGRGLGKALVRAISERYPVTFQLGTNEMSTGVFLSLGWTPMGSLHRYQRVLFPGNELKELRSAPLIRDLANAVSRPLRGRVDTDPRVTQVEKLDRTFDDFWERASSQWPCVVTRSSAYLSWQYERQPGKHFDIFGFYRDGRLDGYAVLFLRSDPTTGLVPKAAVSELWYSHESPGEVIAALLKRCLAYCIEHRAGSMVVDTHDEIIEAVLKDMRFWSV